MAIFNLSALWLLIQWTFVNFLISGNYYTTSPLLVLVVSGSAPLNFPHIFITLWFSNWSFHWYKSSPLGSIIFMKSAAVFVILLFAVNSSWLVQPNMSKLHCVSILHELHFFFSFYFRLPDGVDCGS